MQYLSQHIAIHVLNAASYSVRLPYLQRHNYKLQLELYDSYSLQLCHINLLILSIFVIIYLPHVTCVYLGVVSTIKQLAMLYYGTTLHLYSNMIAIDLIVYINDFKKYHVLQPTKYFYNFFCIPGNQHPCHYVQHFT